MPEPAKFRVTNLCIRLYARRQGLVNSSLSPFLFNCGRFVTKIVTPNSLVTAPERYLEFPD